MSLIDTGGGGREREKEGLRERKRETDEERGREKCSPDGEMCTISNHSGKQSRFGLKDHVTAFC